MRPPRFFIWFPAIILCLVILASGVYAQTPEARDRKPPHRTVPATSVAAHVRFWKADLREFPLLRLTMTPAGSTPRQRAAAREFGTGGPGCLFHNYTEMPAGHGTLELFDAPASAGNGSTAPHALVSQPVDFAPGSFVTILLDEPRKAGTSPQIVIIVDSLDSQKEAPLPAQINVRNFVAGLQDVHVTFGDSLSAQFAGGNNYLQMRGLKAIVYPVRTSGTGTDGKPFEWNTEADLRQHHHQTLLIFPDPYGRVRPRMSVDGENPVEPAADKEEQR